MKIGDKVYNPYTKENEEVTRIDADGVYYVKQSDKLNTAGQPDWAIRFPSKEEKCSK